MKLMGLKKVKLQIMNTFLTLQSFTRTCTNPQFQKSPRKKTAQEKNTQIQKKALVRNTLYGFIVVNTNQWLLIQKVFATWINVKFVKVISNISKVYFHSFLKFFYPVIYWCRGSKNSIVLGFCLL